MSRDTLVTTRWVLLASRGNRPGTLPNILQCTGQASQPRSTQPETSIVLRMRKAALVELTNKGLKAGGGRCGAGSREAPKCPGCYQWD